MIASLAAWPVCRRRPSERMADDRQTRHFNLADEARAIENQVVWVSSDQTGALGPLRLPGSAKVVDPAGVVLASTGLEARVPFLDREVINWALRLPPGFKLAGDGQPEKRLLREAFEGWLPREFLWREKAEFGDGSDGAGVLAAAIEADVTDAQFAAEKDGVRPALRTEEELACHRIFREHLAGVSAEKTISRFAMA